MAGFIHDWLTDQDHGRPDDHHPAVDERGYALWTDPDEQRPAARWPAEDRTQVGGLAGSFNTTDDDRAATDRALMCGPPTVDHDEATAWADSPDNPANYEAGGGCEMYTDDQAAEQVTDDQAAVLAYGYADDQRAGWYGGDGRGDGYGANGTAADYEIVQLEDAADHGY